jgi:hypothetical protein
VTPQPVCRRSTHLRVRALHLGETTLERAGRLLAALAFALAVLLGLAFSAHAQNVLPTVSLLLTVDVRDHDSWFDAYQEILATPSPSPEALMVTIVSRTPRRSIMLLEPRFSATMTGTAVQAIRVVVRGNMAGSDALATLQAFMYSLYEPGGEIATVRLDYALSYFTGDLVELKTQDR